MALEYTEEKLNSLDKETIIQLFLSQQEQLKQIDQTLARVVKAASDHGLSKDALESMEETELHHTLFPEEAMLPTLVTPDFPYIHKELLKNGVTLKLLWQEYVDNCRDAGKPPYGYSQYCKLYQDYVVQNKLTMHIQPQPVHQVYD